MKKTLSLVALPTAITAFVLLFAACSKKNDLRQVTTDVTTTQVQQHASLKAQTIEELVKAYFKGENSAMADKIVTVTNGFLANNHGEMKFGEKKPCRIQPIYAYGIEGVAYYEVWFTEDEVQPKGWALISATEKDYPLVNFSDGTPYSSHLITNESSDKKVYRFGVSYYALEENGNKVKDYGQMPKQIINTELNEEGNGKEDSKTGEKKQVNAQKEMKEGVDYFTVHDYNTLKQLFPRYYYTAKRAQNAKEILQKLFSGNSQNNQVESYQYRWVGGSSAYYTQIPAYTGWNGFGCWSGCNNNAWANIFGWWDANRGKAALIPTTSTGETSPLYRNTVARQNSIDPVQMYIRSISNTYCGSGTGWTYWYDTWRGYAYAPAKGYGYNYWYRWANSPGSHVDLANIVTDGIANNYTPVYVGANSHAYVGLGWAQWTGNTDWTWAYCYPGWNTDTRDNVWIWWHDFNASVRLFVY